MIPIERSSGILLHLTSLPGPLGIGGLGRGACRFIDFLAASGQGWWQFLPTGPTSPDFGNSPYMSLSAFAGNPLLIDIEALFTAGLLTENDLPDDDFSVYSVDFDRIIPRRQELLGRAFIAFQSNRGNPAFKQGFDQFCRQRWLNDYAMFMTLRQAHAFKPWYEWPTSLARRKQATMDKARQENADLINYYCFEQFCFYRQWTKLKEYAKGKNVGLIGDLPYYIGLDSADVWANQDLFMLDKEGRPTHIAGVPPDYFSVTGQRWGNPIYRWFKKKQLNPKLLVWWKQRLEHIFTMVDMVRIDHFRGFESFWRIPVKEATAVHGKWVKGPGIEFFDWMGEQLGSLPIIAEDLGIITDEVTGLRRACSFPGMKVLHFAFDGKADNLYLPHNYDTTNCVVYTGTHDNNTTLGWFLSDQISDDDRATIRRHAHMSNDGEVHWAMIDLAFSSIADLAIIPMQDILGFGEDCRMNLPGTGFNNWQWRLSEEFMTNDIIERLTEVTRLYNR